MPGTRLFRVVLVAVALMATACLDTTDPNKNTTGAPPISATIDGTPWYATGVVVTPTASSLTITGANAASNAGISFIVNGNAPGTYALGPGALSVGVVGITTGQAWSTDGDSASGSIVVTTFVNRHIIGTFEFAAVPLQGGATGKVHVTEGKFDVSY